MKKKSLFQSKKSAFTLAEVLITLGIIGVVAALTLPTIIAKYQEKQTVTSLKKFYSIVSQAYQSALNEYGTPDTWYEEEMSKGSPDAAKKMSDIFTKYIKVSKICYSDLGCFPDVTYTKLDGKDGRNMDRYNAVSKFITADGMSVFIYSYGSADVNLSLGKVYGVIGVDINGFKKPNTFGKDLFSFVLGKDRVIPCGTSSSTMPWTDEEGTLVELPTFPNSCNTNECIGLCEGCAAWVLFQENMDYLHCDDLSWDGKTSCK